MTVIEARNVARLQTALRKLDTYTDKIIRFCHLQKTQNAAKTHGKAKGWPYDAMLTDVEEELVTIKRHVEAAIEFGKLSSAVPREPEP